ncbi:MAG TPA: cell envelope integrity protein TolA [Ramlibacter sp.]
MDTAADDDRLAFAPPQQPGLLRSFALAVLAHGLLVAGLMQGLQWKRDAQDAAVEAELWSALPREAAPREVPPPPPPPEPVVKAPPPAPVVKAPPQPDPQVQRDAQIALEREKEKRERELEKRELEKRRLVEQRARLEAQKKKQREEELAKKKLEQQKLVAEAKRKEEEKKRRQQEQEAREAKRVAQLREENLRRIQGMAGTGAPSSTGSAAQSSGPSAGWGAKVQARVRPNIVFTDAVSGNPKAEVEVRTAPDGTIVSKKLVRSSGVKAWDEAVLRALDKTETLPRDVDGRVPSPVIIDFRPRG